MQEQITAALKKIGHPVSPRELAKDLGVTPSALSYHLKNMLEAKTLKAQGTTSGRRFGLPEHDFSADSPAPPQRRTKHKKAKHGKTKKSPAPRAARTAAVKPAAERFIPAVDASSRLIIVNGAEPHIFTEEQTEAIATLLYQHYKA